MYANVGSGLAIINLFGYLYSFGMSALAYIFDLSTSFTWGTQFDGQIILTSNDLPTMTQKGEDILAAIMTIVHNGIVAVAQISTLLPANM